MMKAKEQEELPKKKCTYDAEEVAQSLIDRLVGRKLPLEKEYSNYVPDYAPEVRHEYTNYDELSYEVKDGCLQYSDAGGVCDLLEDELWGEDCDKLNTAHWIIKNAANDLAVELRAEWKERRDIIESRKKTGRCVLTKDDLRRLKELRDGLETNIREINNLLEWNIWDKAGGKK